MRIPLALSSDNTFNTLHWPSCNNQTGVWGRTRRPPRISMEIPLCHLPCVCVRVCLCVCVCVHCVRQLCELVRGYVAARLYGQTTTYSANELLTERKRSMSWRGFSRRYLGTPWGSFTALNQSGRLPWMESTRFVYIRRMPIIRLHQNDIAANRAFLFFGDKHSRNLSN